MESKREIRVTPRHKEIGILITEGLPNKTIAKKLGIAEITVKIHLSAMFQVFNVKNRTMLARRMDEYLKGKADFEISTPDPKQLRFNF